MIKHDNIFKTDATAEHYSKKDGVAVKYVCTSALGGEARAMDIFYRATPHPEFGNRYFGLYIDQHDRVMITNADAIEDAHFAMIEDFNGDLHYSAHRHDYKSIDGKMIFRNSLPAPLARAASSRAASCRTSQQLLKPSIVSAL